MDRKPTIVENTKTKKSVWCTTMWKHPGLVLKWVFERPVNPTKRFAKKIKKVTN